MFLTLVSLFVVTSVASTVAAVDEQVDEQPCRLWFAPSYLSTDKEPKFGLFAGEPGFSERDIIPSHETAIPIIDFLNSPAASHSDHNRIVLDYLESQVWLSDYAGSKFESNSSTSAFIPGIGALANGHSGMANVDWVQGSIVNRGPDALVREIKGKAHPSRGSISPYYNATLSAIRPIQAGMELFAQLGDDEGDPANDIFQDTLTRSDYSKADKVLDAILDYMDTYGDQMSDKLKNDVLDFMLDTILQGAASKRAKVIRSLIPDRPDKLRRVKEVGGTFAYRNQDIVRSTAWLQKHGLCVDNMKVGRSTIPDAGRGAFANRAIKAESVISPVPMIPILNAEVFDLYSETKAVETRGVIEYVADESKPPTGQQLILNYCFGHHESSLLLLPSAPMVNMINHAPENSQVNAFLRWSKHDDVYNDHGLHDSSIDAFRLDRLPPIIMELVALRDIGKDEEIFIDYGEDWSKSWNEWRNGWSALYESVSPDGDRHDKWPLQALDLRSMYKDKPFPVGLKEGQVPYTPGVVTACFVEALDELPDGWPKSNANGQEIGNWKAPTTFEDFSGQILAVCDLLSREEVTIEGSPNKTYTYTVITRLKDTEQNKLLEVRNVPHSVITLVDRPYAGDMHAPHAFRRWISLEDQRFPQMWRNLRNHDDS